MKKTVVFTRGCSQEELKADCENWGNQTCSCAQSLIQTPQEICALVLFHSPCAALTPRILPRHLPLSGRNARVAALVIPASSEASMS
ncbi:pancreatic polypeptide prohormone isoform X3 [Alexandromys fortis]|uniref:pancreatic polypeptide prohormone isoform X3 n=1 Tax=Alexandromys fortis TaxID=100897 RepID=UPI00215234F9|nr:pancreatic prohormone isoform X3 [Microtus fortis]